MLQKLKIRWLKRPVDEDYPAALSFLTLLYASKKAAAFVKHLRHAPISDFKAKDIFRASGLPLLPVTNGHVKADLIKVKKGCKMVPLLLVRDSAHGKVVIADGYHRLCAVYSCDEDAVIPCQIV